MRIWKRVKEAWRRRFRRRKRPQPIPPEVIQLVEEVQAGLEKLEENKKGLKYHFTQASKASKKTLEEWSRNGFSVAYYHEAKLEQLGRELDSKGGGHHD